MTQQKEATIGNASAIIERFGGIRPMASKINVPVTTVQGWKKRNVIPAGRLEQIVEAARQHSVEISDIVNAETIANQNAKESSFRTEAPRAETFKETGGSEIRPFVNPFKGDDKKSSDSEGVRTSNVMPNVVYEDLVKNISDKEKRTIRKSVAFNAACLLLAAGALAMMFWPQSPMNNGNARVKELEQQLAQLRSDMAQSQQGQQDASSFTVSAVQLQRQAETAGAQAVAATAELFGPALNQIQTTVTQMASSPALAAAIERYTSIRSTEDGQQKLSAAWSELSRRLSNTAGFSDIELDGVLQNTREQEPALTELFSGVDSAEIRPAMLLFGMEQVRAVLGQDNASLLPDLQALATMAGNEDPDLSEAIGQLMPVAGEGVLSPGGLSGVLQSMSGDIVSASLSGDDVSMQERAKARLNNVIEIEKDGALISGTPVQASITQAQHQLAEGDVMGAIASMQSLQGPGAQAAAPWLQKANVTLMAQQLKNTLTRTINVKTGSGVTTADAPLVSNPASYYKPAIIQQ